MNFSSISSEACQMTLLPKTRLAGRMPSSVMGTVTGEVLQLESEREAAEEQLFFCGLAVGPARGQLRC